MHLENIQDELLSSELDTFNFRKRYRSFCHHRMKVKINSNSDINILFIQEKKIHSDIQMTLMQYILKKRNLFLLIEEE